MLDFTDLRAFARIAELRSISAAARALKMPKSSVSRALVRLEDAIGTVVYPLNRKAYLRRNVIERLFGRLKNWKRIATRFDRLAIHYLAAIALISTVTQWLG